MGRPKKIKIYEKTGKPYRSDRELVYAYQHCRKASNKQDAAEELWDKYFLLRMKMKHELEALAYRNNIKMYNVIEEYDSEAWIKFIEQMSGIRLEDVEHLPNWSVWIRLWGYWRSMNRDLVKHWYDWRINTTPIVGITRDSGDENSASVTNIEAEHADRYVDTIQNGLESSSNQKIFWEAFKRLEEELTPKQKKLLVMKQQGVKNKEIVEKLRINNKIMKENLEMIKYRLSYYIVKVSEEYGEDTSYEELLESFA